MFSELLSLFKYSNIAPVCSVCKKFQEHSTSKKSFAHQDNIEEVDLLVWETKEGFAIFLYLYIIYICSHFMVLALGGLGNGCC